MKDKIEVTKQVKNQIAHCMAFYGDEPSELMFKLECLVLEWYEKGKNNDKSL